MAEDNNAKPAEGDANAKASAPAATSAKNPLLVIVLLLNTVALGAVAFFQFSFFKKEAEKPDLVALVKQEMSAHGSAEAQGEQATAMEEQEGLLLPLEAFTVNLAQGDGPRRYLRMEAVLKFDKVSKEEEFHARKPQIRDAVIGILNSKRPEDLLKKEGKTYLKEEIKSAINSFLVNGSVVDLYYVSFQIN